jgi:mannosyltransferase
VVGIVAAILGYAGAGVPSYWGDEAASLMSAERSWPSLWAELSQVDAVHGLYYALLHVWIDVFGASEWSTRALSALAVGLLAAGTVVLGARWFSLRVGVVAGIVCAVLPRTTYLATEARSYALAAAAAVWLTVAFVTLVQRRRTEVWRWALYGVGFAASVMLFLHLAVLVLVHAVALAAERPRAPRGVVRCWIGGTVLGGLLALPLAIVALTQRDQLGYLVYRDWARPRHVLVTQWFDSPAVAVIAWVLVIVGVGGSFLARGRLVAPPAGLWPVLAWFVLPSALLLLADTLITKTYSPRYASWCLAAVGLLIALGIDRVASAVAAITRRADASHQADTSHRADAPGVATATAAALVVVLAAAAAPTYLAQRTEFAKDGGADFRAVADYVREHAEPGDAVVFGLADRRAREPRLAVRLYPDAFTGLDDVQLRVPYDETAGLWDEVWPLDAVADDLRSDTAWAIDAAGDAAGAVRGGSEQRVTPTDPDLMRAAGYRLVDRERLPRTTITRWQRDD